MTGVQTWALPISRNVRVYAVRGQDTFSLEIEDDGRGFDTNIIHAGSESFGQGIMAQRAAEAGGFVEVNSAPGKGTRVLINVPLDRRVV